MLFTFLEVATPEGRNLNIRLGDCDPIRIGRDPRCDLVLADPRISRNHALIWQLNRGYRLEAVGRNGTRVNGRKVNRRLIRNGDIIELAGFRIALRDRRQEDGPEPTRAAPPQQSRFACFGRMSTRSERMIAVFEQLRRVANSDAPVLILGESGTGKDLAARALHDEGLRRSAPFVPLNCASLPQNLIESELFGHERGAFTGALGRRAGAFELADGGTLFLDEIGEMPLDLQPRLLRVLESGEVRRIGGPAAFHVGVRVVAATNRDLNMEVAAGRFRADLYYRLRVIEARLPPLRERPEDLPLLVDSLLREFGGGPRRLSRNAEARLRSHRWPGNVRELKNVLVRAALLSDRETIPADRLDLVETPSPGLATLADMMRAHVLAVLASCGGNRAEAARRLGISRTALFDRLKRYREEDRVTPITEMDSLSA